MSSRPTSASMPRTARCCWTSFPRPGSTRIVPADGAFYLYVDVGDFTSDSVAFTKEMLDDIGVAATPGRRLRCRARQPLRALLLRRHDGGHGRGRAPAAGLEPPQDARVTGQTQPVELLAGLLPTRRRSAAATIPCARGATGPRARARRSGSAWTGSGSLGGALSGAGAGSARCGRLGLAAVGGRRAPAMAAPASSPAPPGNAAPRAHRARGGGAVSSATAAGLSSWSSWCWAAPRVSGSVAPLPASLACAAASSPCSSPRCSRGASSRSRPRRPPRRPRRRRRPGRSSRPSSPRVRDGCSPNPAGVSAASWARSSCGSG